MKRHVMFLFFWLVFIFKSVTFLSAEEKNLSLDEAIVQALEKNPGLLASHLEVEAREASISQAGAYPNPEFSVLTEDFGGSGAFDGFSRSQTTGQLSQRVELGGKRGARRNIAALNRDIAKAEFERSRREIVAGVRRAFFAVLVAQERVRLMEELMKVSQQFSDVVHERIQAGKIPPIDEVKAKAIVASAEIDLARSQRELESAHYELAAAIGVTRPEVDRASGNLFTESPEVALPELIDSLPENPELQKAIAEIEESRALMTSEKAKAVPDLVLTGGYRVLETTDDHSFVLGASIPLPLFDRNKGGILEAQSRLRKAEQTRNSAQLQITSSLTIAYQLYSSSRGEAEALRARVLPANQAAFDAISEGYRLGKYGYLEVLESQRSLFSSRLQLLRALGDFHAAATEIERITGKELLRTSLDSREDTQ